MVVAHLSVALSLTTRLHVLFGSGSVPCHVTNGFSPSLLVLILIKSFDVQITHVIEGALVCIKLLLFSPNSSC